MTLYHMYLPMPKKWTRTLTNHCSSDPPAKYIKAYGVYATTCNATVPEFGFELAKQKFVMHPQDMLLHAPIGGLCGTSFTRGLEVPGSAYPDGFFIIGAAFLHNVVAVFDIGASGVWVAKHDY